MSLEALCRDATTVRGHQQLGEAREGQGPETSEGASSGNKWTVDFQPPELGKNKFPSEPPSCGTSVWRSLGADGTKAPSPLASSQRNT